MNYFFLSFMIYGSTFSPMIALNNFVAASWRWTEFSSPILFIGMLITASILKIVFHHIHFLEKILPESCVLIVVGRDDQSVNFMDWLLSVTLHPQSHIFDWKEVKMIKIMNFIVWTCSYLALVGCYATN